MELDFIMLINTTKRKTNAMNKLYLYLLVLTMFVQCRKENEDCHFFITIKNNSSQEIIFGFPGSPSDSNLCTLHDDVSKIKLNKQINYRPYSFPDCIETRIKLEGNLRALFIVDPNNYTTEAVPCEEFKERNTILRTYILTLEDLERMDYTINYPEDASIGVD
jgi:hypothetical protein